MVCSEESKNYRFSKTNRKTNALKTFQQTWKNEQIVQKTFTKLSVFFTERTIFWNKTFKNNSSFHNKQFFS